ncbi:hypothetical protein ACJVC5_14915 [Peredibacter sp. HCB2-198]|uniref:hypothetical protein n=1 Tax=Peredibacter sp. HCB2-198 TaxID=3383025 RepID=UPI0038B600EE
MKMLAAVFFLLSSMSAFAISDQKLVDKCFPYAQEKMIEHAKKLNCSIGEDPFTITGIDNRTLNPWKYLRWEMKVDCPEHQDVKEITAVTQYSAFDKTCF